MIDQEKIKEGVRLLLEGIGEDPSREGLIETPDRIARMYTELFSSGFCWRASAKIPPGRVSSRPRTGSQGCIPSYSVAWKKRLPHIYPKCFIPTIRKWCWKRTLPFIPPVSTICCPSSARFILLTSPTERLLA